MLQGFPVEGDRAHEGLAQWHLGLPAKDGPDAGEVRIVVADVDPLTVGREGAELIAAAAVDLYHQIGKVLEVDDALAAQVEHLAIRLLARGRHEESIYRVVHVGEIA